MKQPKKPVALEHSKRIQWPHYINHDEQLVSVNVNGWISACGAANAVKKWYPGYRCELVSEERLEQAQKKETK